MTKEEIRKLLGGYATNNLTETERTALFEAALDDQELFDALQQEQALKNVLENPVARAEIRQALEHPRGARSAWWVWGGAVGALAAAAVLVVVIWPRSDGLLTNRTEIATAQRPPQPLPAPVLPPLRSSSPVEAPRQSSQPAFRSRKPSAPSPAAAPSPDARRAPSPLSASPALQPEIARDQEQTRGSVSLARGPQAGDQLNTYTDSGANRGIANSLFGYTLLEQHPGSKDAAPVAASALKTGDLVRIQVSTPSRGRVVLMRLDPAGAWQTIGSTATGDDRTAVLPNDPIVVTADAQKFRLTLEPVGPDAKVTGTVARLVAPTAPRSIEITIVAATR